MTDAFPLTLSLSANIPDERLDQLTRDLERDLIDARIQARPVEASPAPGERGEPVTLGVLALALITSGAVTAIIECLKVYLSREPALTIKVTDKDGKQVEITTRNVEMPDVHRMLDELTVKR
jgi:hypothetical protein